MLDKLTAVLKESSASKMVALANTLGLVPPRAQIMISALNHAPPPVKTELTKDWLKNLDVLADSLGCVVAGAYDSLVVGLSNEEIAALDPDVVLDTLEIPWMRSVLRESWLLCTELYLEKGSIAQQIADGIVPPDGLMTKAFLSPWAKAQQALMREQGANTSPLKSLVNVKNVSSIKGDII